MEDVWMFLYNTTTTTTNKGNEEYNKFLIGFQKGTLPFVLSYGHVFLASY